MIIDIRYMHTLNVDEMKGSNQMEQGMIDAATKTTKDLLAAASTNAELKKAAQVWLDAADKDAATPAYVEVLKNGVSTIDELLGFASSADAVKFLGADAAKGLLAHAKELKAQGAPYCDCAGCTAALNTLKALKAL